MQLNGKVIGLVAGAVALTAGTFLIGFGDEANSKVVDGKIAIENSDFRHAISQSIKRDELVDTVLNNGSTAHYNLMPKNFVTNPSDGSKEFVAETNEMAISSAKDARESLKKAKQAFVKDGHCEVVDKCSVDLEILLTSSESSVNIGKKLKADIQGVLGKDNVDVTLKNTEWSTLLDLKHKGEFDMVFSGWGPDYADPMTFLELWETGNGHNDAGFSNAKFDAIMKKARLEVGSDEGYETNTHRYYALVEAEEILMKELPMVPLFQRGRSVLWSDRVTIKPFTNALGADYEYKYADITDTDKIYDMIVTSAMPTLDSTLATDQESFQGLQLTAENIFRNGNQSPEKGDTITESVLNGTAVVSSGLTGVKTEDGYKYTIKITNQTPWVNNKGEDLSSKYGVVSAHDYEFAWKLLGDANHGSQYKFMIDDVLGVQKDTEGNLMINAIDDTTLEFTLNSPKAYIKSLLTFGVFAPIDEEFYNAVGGKDSYGTSAEKYLSSGPFYLKTYAKNTGEVSEFVKNPHYYDKNVVKLNGIKQTFNQGFESGALVEEYAQGNVHIAGLTSELVDQYLGNNELVKIPSSTSFYVTFNIGNNK